MTLLLALGGCMTMDGFFFDPEKVDAYALETEVIPPDLLEEVSFPSEDGTMLYGVWAHQEVEDAPVYLYFHGNWRNIDQYMRRVDTYWSLGFETFIFDYRGYGKSEGSPTFDGVMADGRAAVAYVEGATGKDSAELNYHGLSLGGSVAIHTAVTDPPHVLISEDLFANVDKIIDDGSGQDLPPGWFVEDEWDNVAVAPDVHVPYLVMHAEDDDFIRSDSAQLLYDAANEPKQLWFAPGCDHDTTPDILPEEYQAWITCWVAQDCPAD